MAVMAVLLALGALLFVQKDDIVAGAEAYVFGYPLVILDVTRQGAALTRGPENHLLRARHFPDASFRDIVRPNVDTLYTSAFIDTLAGPWVFEMPANAERYELMQFMDAWTNVFAAPGTRTTGTAGGAFLLVGPGWTGDVPEGLTLLRAPTQIVWLLGRTQTNGAADYPVVHRLQDGLKLRTLAAWREGRDDPPPAWHAAAVLPRPPVVQLRRMDVETFFTRLATLMVNNPPVPADPAMMDKLARIGVAPGKAPDWGLLDRLSIGLGRWIAERKVAQAVSKPGNLVRGWSMPPAELGNYGTAYATRFAVAMVALGANLPADALYPRAREDAKGQALNGRHRYRLHFPADALPPANAFWSVTAYGADDFLIDNPINRYALGDRDPLTFNADGSLDLYVQADPPPDDQRSNWLPVKANEPFDLMARIYWPRPPALDGTWSMPAVERVD